MLSLTIFAVAAQSGRRALLSHDQEAEERRLSALFAQARPEDRQAPQLRHLL
jgi:hypothetical protein